MADKAFTPAASRAPVAPAPALIYSRHVITPLYNRDILRLAASIPHVGRLDAAQARVERRSAVCGSRVAVDIVLDQEGRVRALAQEVNACALGQAAASLMGTSVIGASAAELAAARDALAGYLAGTRADPGAWPGLEILGVARPFAARHASILLAFEAAAAAAEAACAGQARAGAAR